MNEHERRPRPMLRQVVGRARPAAQARRATGRYVIAVAIGALAFAASTPALPQADASVRTEAASARLFAIEITVGPAWDASKPPNAQAFFQEHSANLRRLRESGHLVMGARYSDKGLVVVRAGSVEEVREMMAQDESIEAGTFKYEVHPFAVFYPGAIEAHPPK